MIIDLTVALSAQEVVIVRFFLHLLKFYFHVKSLHRILYESFYCDDGNGRNVCCFHVHLGFTSLCTRSHVENYFVL